MEIQISEFKAKSLGLIAQVHKTSVPLIVTKHGKPLVKIIPVEDEAESIDLHGLAEYNNDDLLSTGETWNADS